MRPDQSPTRDCRIFKQESADDGAYRLSQNLWFIQYSLYSTEHIHNDSFVWLNADISSFLVNPVVWGASVLIYATVGQWRKRKKLVEASLA